MKLETLYGNLDSYYDEEYFEDGSLKGCSFERENQLKTEYGVLVPRYGPEDVRKKYGKAIGFFPNGILKRIALEHQTEIESPIGPFPAELITFYDDGSVCRIFPLNGKISGFWSEQDEEKLAVPMHFSLAYGDFSVKIISIHFYRNGNIQSITLFPCERITLNTPLGAIKVRNGFSLYDDGRLQSLEPAEPTAVSTPIGVMHAFDSNPIGITADQNSLLFSPDGTVQHLSTVTDKIVVQLPDARLETVAPVKKTNPLDDETSITLPVTVKFQKDSVSFRCEQASVYSLQECAFTILRVPYVTDGSPCSACSGCSL